MNTIPYAIQPVTDREFALGATDLGSLVPAEHEIPPRFFDQADPWNLIAGRILDRGISMDHALDHRAGVDVHAALRHLGAVMQSPSCDDRLKTAAAAYLLHSWFVSVQVGDCVAKGT